MSKYFHFLFLILLLGLAPHVMAGDTDSTTDVSTMPIGSAYYRHLADRYKMDLHELVKFEKKGFGRSEIVSLILISSATGKSMKDMGNRRIKDNVTLEELATSNGLNYKDIYLKSREVKIEIEKLGEENLPPPVFDVPPVADVTQTKKDKKKKQTNDQEI